MAAEVTRASTIDKSERGKGAVRIRSRDALWAAKAAPPSVTLGWTRRSLTNRLLIRPAPVQDLLLCAKHLFVAPMVAWVHRAAGNRQIKYSGGEVRAAVGRGDVGPDRSAS
jgi:hypothetical protein